MQKTIQLIVFCLLLLWAANTIITMGMLGWFSELPRISIPFFNRDPEPLLDPDSPKVTDFIDQNLSSTIRIEGNEAWCEKSNSTPLHFNTNPSSATPSGSKKYYHLQNISVIRRLIPLEPHDHLNKVQFRIELSILSTSYRMRTENDNWTDVKNGSPLSLKFIVESIDGKLHWSNLSNRGIQAS